MDASAINVKAYLEKPGQSQAEIRRFNLEEGASTNHEYLSSKLNSIFPSLPETGCHIYWKDEEGDLIAIGSDDELIQALLYGRPEGLLKLYLRPSGSPTGAAPGFSCGANAGASGPSAEHPGVVCDGCDGTVRGIRFKCMVCPDFDLCTGCCDKGIHNHHHMLRMAQPATEWTGRPCGGPGRGGNRAGWWWPGHPGAGRHGGAWNPRRFWKQFMRGQWQNGEGAGCPSANQNESTAAPGSASTDSTQQQTPGDEGAATSQAQQREFLEHVGQQVSAILEPFGILVDVEERNAAGPQGQQTGKTRGRCSRNGKCRPDPQCKKNCGDASKVSGQTEAQGAEAPPTVANTDAKSSANKNEGAASASAPEPKQREESDMDSDESSWIKVENKNEDMDVIVLEPPQVPPTSTPSAPPANDASSQAPDTVPMTRLYPNLSSEPSTRPKGSPPSSASGGAASSSSKHQPITDLDEKVFQAVNQMKAMGFHDNGGWMTAMLYQNDGEIYKVIDHVLKAAHNKKN